MKIRLSFFCIALALAAVNYADAQQEGWNNGGRVNHFSGNLLQPGRPGRVWFESNAADKGLGYEGSYLTLGGKTRLREDRLDGRWLIEGQLHQSLKDGGGFFANIGLERVFSVDAAGADVAVGVFYDYDGDTQASYSHKFNQVGVTGSIKTRRWDLTGSGYFPTNTDGYVYGDAAGIDCFVENYIIHTAGIDSALQGFDVSLRTRPEQLAFINGHFDIGGYQYSSDLVNAFGGGRLGFGFQGIGGMLVNVEINSDSRFNTTGVIGVGYVFGANASGSGHEYSALGRDLEKMVRNDHIVRYNQDIGYVINPITGLPYNVIHTDNLAAAGGDGTAESPFDTLAASESASVVSDMIYVHAGDGTDNGQDGGITLKDNQLLVGPAGPQFIPAANGTFFQLCDTGGVATISNSGGNEVVLLANNNFVGGLTIDGTGATYGIFGNGVDTGSFSDNTISSASLDGIGLQNITGNWDFSNNTVMTNGQDGIFINGAMDPTSVFTFTDNIVSNNTLDGLHLRNYDGVAATFLSNATDDNGRHGLFLENHLNGAGTGINVNIVAHLADGNAANGITIAGGNGNLNVINPTITNNAGIGLQVRNWTDPLAGDSTFIGGIGGSFAQFTGNGTGLSIELDIPGLVQDVLVTQIQVDGNGTGLQATSRGIGTVLNLDILENRSFSNNRTEGIRMLVDNSGVINNRIINTGLELAMVGNNADGGGALAYVLDGPNGNPASEINSFVSNVNINTVGDGISVDGVGNSQVNLLVEDSTVLGSIGIRIDLDNDANQLINATYFDNIAVRGDIGVLGISGTGTLWDFSMINSNVQSNGILAGVGETLDINNPAIYTPYTDIQGDFGIVLTAIGGGPLGPLFDNLTRINLQNNVVRDFTFDGVTIQSFGDAQLLATIRSNQIFNNGPGLDDDPDGDGIPEGPNSPAVVPTEGFFHDGLVIVANDLSTISTRIENNQITNNFERGITMATVGNGTINASMIDNLLSNDIGIDNTPSPPGPTGNNVFDMDVLNDVNGNICLDMSNNSFRLLPINFAQAGAPGVPSLLVGLDGASNGFTDADLPGFVGPIGFGLCDALITAEELFFQATGGFQAPVH